ncbi:MAG: NAD(P)-dependent oxidoreductase [Desulfovibrio sp.]|nr:NAD(P)-dependent oxidoreductase [Desulfovibrio sp.]
MANTLRIGWIGTGVMGLSMAGHLLNAGYALTLFNRTKAKAAPLLDRGAQWADSPRLVAESSDVVFSIVGYPSDVEEVMLGKEGAIHGLAKGGVLCDMSTSSPTLAERLATTARQQGCDALDAPVTGGDVGAREARLSIFVGGESQTYERLLPCFQKMGTKILHCGGPGFGQKAKLANQVAIAGVMFSTCESLLFAQEAGLNVAQWMELVVAGAAGSAAMNTLGRRMLKKDFAPGFFIDHFIKDLGLCLEECRRLKLVLPGTTLADALYRSMQARGKGKEGTQALIECLADLSAKQWHGEK